MDITGVVGGSGFYSFLSDVDEVAVDTPHGPGGTVSITAESDGDDAVLAVQDQCGGIPEDQLDRVFDTAWRASTARTPGTGSHGGLGLATVHGIMKAHGGASQWRTSTAAAGSRPRSPASELKQHSRPASAPGTARATTLPRSTSPAARHDFVAALGHRPAPFVPKWSTVGSGAPLGEGTCGYWCCARAGGALQAR